MPTKAELVKENKELKKLVEEMGNANVVKDVPCKELLEAASERTDDARAKKLISRAIRRLGE